jgi:hypothetical protein
MSPSEQQIAANRSNSLKSTGPNTDTGKAIVSNNALKHGVFSRGLLIEGEKPAEFRQLVDDLTRAFKPASAIEAALVDRIAVTMWRQRRLVSAESAALATASHPKKIASAVSQEFGLCGSSKLSEADLVPFDRSQEKWCRAAVEEFEGLEKFDLKELRRKAPLIWRHLEAYAQEDNETVEQHLSAYEDSLNGFLARLIKWCRKELEAARQRPQILAAADLHRARQLVLPAQMLELFARYQTTLDNQLYKALRMLREIQEWRIETVEPEEEKPAA